MAGVHLHRDTHCSEFEHLTFDIAIAARLPKSRVNADYIYVRLVSLENELHSEVGASVDGIFPIDSL